MERHGGEYFTGPHEFNPNSFPNNSSSWYSDDHRPNFPDNYFNHHRRNCQYDQVNGEPNDFFSGQAPPFSGRKRGFYPPPPPPPPDNFDSGSPAKLYVAPIPRTATEEDIRPLFEVHGNVIEVVLPRDRRTGQHQGYCFVKFMTFEEAGSAIRALNSLYFFPGEQGSIKVRFAGGERERPVAPPDKLYIGGLSKQTTRKEIEEVFSPYGRIDDIYVVRDELKQSRGCAFVQFSHRDMVQAAIKGLNGTFTMRGSDQPLVVRIADPKKPRIGELRGNYAYGNPGFGPNFQEPVRPPPNLGDSAGGQMPTNVLHHLQYTSNNLQPQVFPNWETQEAAAPIVMQQLHSSQQQSPSQLSQVTLQQIHTPQQSSQSSQQAVSEMQKQLHLRQSSTQNVEQQQNSQVTMSESLSILNNPQTSASTSSIPTVPQSPQMAASPECDWSEHTCPDGYKYYYNCETSESIWDKPEEYLLFEQQIQKQQNASQQLSSQLVSSTKEVQLQPHVFQQKLQLQHPSMSESELDHLQVQSKSSPVVHPTRV